MHIKVKSNNVSKGVQDNEKLIETILAQLESLDHSEEIVIDSDFLITNNIHYDLSDLSEYDIFVITKERDTHVYRGLSSKSINSYGLVSDHFIGKQINYTLSSGDTKMFLIYSNMWPAYTYPIYIIVHDYKCTIKKFIMIFDNIIKTCL